MSQAATEVQTSKMPPSPNPSLFHVPLLWSFLSECSAYSRLPRLACDHGWICHGSIEVRQSISPSATSHPSRREVNVKASNISWKVLYIVFLLQYLSCVCSGGSHVFSHGTVRLTRLRYGHLREVGGEGVYVGGFHVCGYIPWHVHHHKIPHASGGARYSQDTPPPPLS